MSTLPSNHHAAGRNSLSLYSNYSQYWWFISNSLAHTSSPLSQTTKQWWNQLVQEILDFLRNHSVFQSLLFAPVLLSFLSRGSRKLFLAECLFGLLFSKRSVCWGRLRWSWLFPTLETENELWLLVLVAFGFSCKIFNGLIAHCTF